jgi:hypothetical protein
MLQHVMTSVVENWLGKMAASLASRSGLLIVLAVIAAAYLLHRLSKKLTQKVGIGIGPILAIVAIGFALVGLRGEMSGLRRLRDVLPPGLAAKKAKDARALAAVRKSNAAAAAEIDSILATTPMGGNGGPPMPLPLPSPVTLPTLRPLVRPHLTHAPTQAAHTFMAVPLAGAPAVGRGQAAAVDAGHGGILPLPPVGADATSATAVILGNGLASARPAAKASSPSSTPAVATDAPAAAAAATPIQARGRLGGMQLGSPVDPEAAKAAQEAAFRKAAGMGEAMTGAASPPSDKQAGMGSAASSTSAAGKAAKGSPPASTPAVATATPASAAPATPLLGQARLGRVHGNPADAAAAKAAQDAAFRKASGMGEAMTGTAGSPSGKQAGMGSAASSTSAAGKAAKDAASRKASGMGGAMAGAASPPADPGGTKPADAGNGQRRTMAEEARHTLDRRRRRQEGNAQPSGDPGGGMGLGGGMAARGGVTPHAAAGNGQHRTLAEEAQHTLAMRRQTQQQRHAASMMPGVADLSGQMGGMFHPSQGGWQGMPFHPGGAAMHGGHPGIHAGGSGHNGHHR